MNLFHNSRPAIRKSGQDEGFTLLELLVVLAIIALLVGFVAPNVMSYLGRAKVDAAKVQMQNIAAALDLYRLDLGAYPSDSEGPRALMQSSSPGWRGPYLTKEGGLIDPWGTPFTYRRGESGNAFTLMSLGADKTPGGDDEDADITYE